MSHDAALKKRETVFVLILLAMVIVMSLHALRVTVKQNYTEVTLHSRVVPDIVVYIEGAVANPGRYHFKKGTTMKDVLEKAQILPDADTTRIKFDLVLRKSRKIKVPFKKAKREKTGRTKSLKGKS